MFHEARHLKYIPISPHLSLLLLAGEHALLLGGEVVLVAVTPAVNELLTSPALRFEVESREEAPADSWLSGEGADLGGIVQLLAHAGIRAVAGRAAVVLAPLPGCRQ